MVQAFSDYVNDRPFLRVALAGIGMLVAIIICCAAIMAGWLGGDADVICDRRGFTCGGRGLIWRS